MSTAKPAPRRFSEAQHPYSASRTAHGLLFVSGQLGVRDGEIVEGGVEPEARQALRNVETVLAEHGCDPSSVLRSTVLLADLADRHQADTIYADFFEEPRPARTCYEVGALPYGARIEVEVTALLPTPPTTPTTTTPPTTTGDGS